jgi:hypothetical protein
MLDSSPLRAVLLDNVYPTLTRGATLFRAYGPLEEQALTGGATLYWPRP